MNLNINGHAARISMLIVAVACAGSCSAPPKRLSSTDAKVCRAQGGYESRAPFGGPFCQFRYGDAGKSCSGKADCQGRCLFYFGGQPNEPKVGDSVAGKCEAERESFGCYGTVEAGKLAMDQGCTD
jgi:hypothetical protein